MKINTESNYILLEIVFRFYSNNKAFLETPKKVHFLKVSNILSIGNLNYRTSVFCDIANDFPFIDVYDCNYAF